jgi:TonB family protein
MKYIAVFSLLGIVLLSTIVYGQDRNPDDYYLRGTVASETGDYIPGILLSFKRDGQTYFSSSNSQGSFEVRLTPGSYEITSPELSAGAFRGLVLIQKNALNPQDIDFVFKASDVCSARNADSNFPAIVKSAVPAYPPAARAVRASGSVFVEAVVGPAGAVTSAKALSGHPLLRAAATEAAKQFVFAADNAGTRGVSLHFIFIEGEGRPNTRPVLQCPNRILTISEPVIIETRDSSVKIL